MPVLIINMASVVKVRGVVDFYFSNGGFIRRSSDYGGTYETCCSSR